MCALVDNFEYEKTGLEATGTRRTARGATDATVTSMAARRWECVTSRRENVSARIIRKDGTASRARRTITEIQGELQNHYLLPLLQT